MFQLVGVLSTDGILLECSGPSLVADGVTREAVIGKPFWETVWWAVTPGTREDLRAAVERASNGESVRCNLPLHENRGYGARAVDFTLLPVRERQGSVVSLLFEGRDATEPPPANPREHHRQKLARITVDSMVQFVGLLDGAGTVLEINQVALDAIGVKLSEVEGKPFWTTFWWQVSKEVRSTLREAIARASQGEFVRWDTEIYGRAGGRETIIIDASLRPVTDEAGRVVFITAEGRDITEKKAHEREIARQREELAQLDELKTRFFSNISHEFRTPLTLIMGPLEDAIAQPELLSAATREQVELAHRNSLRLLKLVNTLLDFSRIEAGRLQASYESTDLALLTSELASNFRSAIERAGMKLLLDCDPLPQPVYVDREMWEKIVLNLISNAFKFTFDGEIEVSLRAVDETAQLTVRDTGIGIPFDEIPRLFDRFHRVKDARGRSYEGSGIGLALVQELVKLHGGAVRVETVLDHGSSFIVSVPFGKGHLPADRIGAGRGLSSAGLRADAYIEEVLRWLPEASHSGTHPDGLTPSLLPAAPRERGVHPNGERPGRILLADDNADMRVYLHRLLDQRGYEIEAVTDGFAALDAARERKPDLVLTDVMMPGLDGFGLLKELRGDANLGTVPIILLSARAGEEASIEGMHAGADDYLIKPFSARELLARVESHLKMSRFRIAAAEAIIRSEERFRALVTASSDVVYRMSADWREMRYVQGHNLPPATEAPGENWLERNVHPEDRSQVHAAIQAAIDAKSIFQLEYRAIGPNGATAWTFSRAIPVTDADDEIIEWFGAAADITKRKQAEQVIAHLTAHSEQLRRLYHTILSSTPDLVYVFDLNHRFTYANEALLRLWGKTSSEAIGKNCLELGYQPWHAAMHDREIDQVIATGKPVRGEVPFSGADGRRIYDYIFVPVFGINGEVEAIAGTTRDVTDRKLAEDELRSANLDLEQFAYAASHDLQEPLRGIRIYSQLLARRYAKNLDGPGLEFLQYLTNGASRMEMLVRDLLAYTRVSQADKPLELVDAGAALRIALDNLSEAIDESGALVTYDPLPFVRVHHTHLQQLFQNLVGNAVKYRRANSPPAIHLSAALEDARWVFTVKDNGIGVEPEYQELIFGLFKRLHAGDQYSGTGIGLAICQRIVERNHGRIWVESEPGKGSRFNFSFPA